MLGKPAELNKEAKKEATEIKLDQTLSGHTWSVNALASLGEGLLASGSYDKTIKVWEVKSGRCVSTLSGHTDGVLALTSLGEGLLASGSHDTTVKVWEVKSGRCVSTLSGHTSGVVALALLGEGLLASGSVDNTIKVWKVKSGRCVSTLSGHTSSVYALTSLGEGLLASGSEDTTIKVWEVKSGRCMSTLSGHMGWVSALTSLEEGLLASGSYDNTVKVWEVKSGRCVSTLSGHTNGVRALTSLGEGLLASGSFDNTIKVWEVKSGRCVSTLSGHTDAVFALTSLGEGLLASGSWDQTIKLWTLPPQLRLTKTGAFSAPVVAGVSVVQPEARAPEHKDTLPATPVTPKPDEKTVSPARPLLPNAGRVPPIAWKDLKVVELIGNGSYGDVYRGEWQKKNGTTEVVAIKLLQLKTLPETLSKEFEREATLMWECRSVPAILQLHGVCTEPGHYAMVMEYMSQSLRQRLQDEKALPWSQRWSIALEMAQGLAYLHSRGILHRDLKSLNILLDAHQHAKISDFGLAKVKLEISSSSTKSHKAVGSVRWRAPELFKRSAVATPAADIYSLGMLLWELATRQLPFSDASDEVTVISWIKDGEQEKIPDDCPPALATIIQACWAAPDKRPTAEDIVTGLAYAKAEAEAVDENKADRSKAAKPWHFDAASKPAPGSVKGYTLIPAGVKDATKVRDYYQRSPVPGYDIRSVQIIYNPNLISTFERTLPLLQERHNQPAFAPQWSTENNKEWRQETANLLERLAAPFQDKSYPAVKLLPLWHGTKAAILDSLFKTGYAALSTTDAGYFGRGIYSAYEARYSYQAYSEGTLLINWVACYSAYPVIDGDMNKLTGKAAYRNYDAHFIPVVPDDPSDPDTKIFLPCAPNQKHRYTEMVVFERAQCLPSYLVELQPTLPKSPAPSKPEKSAEQKAEGYSLAAGLKAFGSKALHHAQPASGNVSQTTASASVTATTPKPKPMPMG